MNEYHREQATEEDIEKSIDWLRDEFHRRIREKGPGIFKSRHEILGVVTEEYQELMEAVHSEDIHKVRNELLDIAVAALFGVTSIYKGVDW